MWRLRVLVFILIIWLVLVVWLFGIVVGMLLFVGIFCCDWVLLKEGMFWEIGVVCWVLIGCIGCGL